MIPILFCLLLLGAMAAALILAVKRPLTLLIKIQIILTVLVVVAFVVGFNIALWLHSTAYDDPARQKWHPILDVLWFGTIIRGFCSQFFM